MTQPPIRVLHIGDLHLGVELYGRPDPEKGYGTRVGDFLGALDQALEHAASTDLIVFPGDFYKNCDPTPTVQREFARRLRRVARDVPVVLIPGNHDLPNTHARASSVDIFHVLELEQVHVLRSPEVRRIDTARGPVLVAPLPFFPRSRVVANEEARGLTIPEVMELYRTRLLGYLEDLAIQVSEHRAELGDAVPALLMAHYTVQGAVFGGYGRGALLAPEVELPLGALRRPEFDYVALAHIHQHQTIPANDFTGQPPVIYAGSIERVDFGEENEEKCVIRVELQRGHARWEKIRLSPRPFLTLRVKCDEVDPLENIRAAIELQRNRLPGAVVRLFYTLPAGQPALPERELRALLQGAGHIAVLRRETPTSESRARHGGMTNQLSPLEALELYLAAQPQLASVKDDLVERARPLIAEVTAVE
jgi:exonuclease SbcD